MNPRIKASPVVATTAVGLIALLVGYGLGATMALREHDKSRMEQPPVVNMALDLYGHGKVSREALQKSLDINVVHLERMTCVELNDARPGRADGGFITTCFDNSDQHVVSKFRSPIY